MRTGGMYNMIQDYIDQLIADEKLNNENESVRNTAEADTDSGKVMLTGECSDIQLKAGDRVTLVTEEDVYKLKDENNHTVNASLCANIPEGIAYHLSRVFAEFEIRKTADNVFRAVLTNPCSLVHHGCSEWCYLG